MHILMVADAFYPEVGGSENVNLELSRMLVARGHNVTVLARRLPNQGWLEQENVQHINVVRYDVDLRSWPHLLFSTLRNLPRAVARLQDSRQIDCVVFHHAVSACAFLLRGLTHSPKVFFFYSPISQEYALEAEDKGKKISPAVRRLPYQLYSRGIAGALGRLHSFGLHRADKVVVLSQYSLSLLKELIPGGKLMEKAAVIPGGISLNDFCCTADRRKLKEELGLPTDRPVVITVRRLAPRMGLENLLEAVSIVLHRGERLHLAVCGRGQLAEELSHMARQLDIDQHVQFVGFVETDRLAKYYQAADVFVMPTKSLEGFGLSTLEALACGTPVLGTPVGATHEILAPLDGRLILNGSSVLDIAQGLGAFPHDEELRSEQFRVKCRGYVEDMYSWERMATSFESLCEGLLKR